jgi:hypothetical protein
MPLGYLRQATLRRKQCEMTTSTLSTARQQQNKHVLWQQMCTQQ